MVYRARTCLLLIALVYSVASATVLSGPMVTQVTTHGARISWITGAEDGRVLIDVDGKERRVEAEIKRFPAKPTARLFGGSRKEKLCRAQLTDLPSATKISYRVVSGADTVSGSLRTSPAATVPFTFVLYGDSRSNPEIHATIANAIASREPHFVINTGDLMANGNVFELWEQQFFAPAARLLRTAPMLVAKGNHERRGKYFDMLFEEYCSFDYANMHVIIINSYIEKDGVDDMIAWLEDDLRGTTKRWTVVTYHYPTFNIGGHATRWGRGRVLPLLKKYGVDLVFTGHSHLYERFRPIGPEGEKPIVYVVSGGGGAPLAEAGSSPLLAGGRGISQHHYCLFSVNGDSLAATVTNRDGQVIDQFTIEKKGSTFAREVLREQVDERVALLATDFERSVSASVVDFDSSTGTVEVEMALKGLPPGVELAVGMPRGQENWELPERKIATIDQDTNLTLQLSAEREVAVKWWGLEPELHLHCSTTVGGLAIASTLTPAVAGSEMVRFDAPVSVAHMADGCVLDGTLEEWADMAVLPDRVAGEPGVLRLAWNAGGLYGALVCSDTMVRVNREAFYDFDCVEMFIEADNAKQDRMHEKAAQYVLFPPEGGTPSPMLAAPAGRRRPYFRAIKVNGALIPEGYILEFFIPARVLSRRRLEVGDQIGFNYAVVDDGEPEHHFAHHKQKRQSYARPISWGTVELAVEN